jgi:hypothetical protein
MTKKKSSTEAPELDVKDKQNDQGPDKEAPDFEKIDKDKKITSLKRTSTSKHKDKSK